MESAAGGRHKGVFPFTRLQAAHSIFTLVQVSGMDVTALVRASERGAAADPNRALADFEANGERIELFLEA